MTPATPATTHASRAAPHMLHAADAAGQPSSGAGPQFAELLQAQRAPQPAPQPQPAARPSTPAARAQQPNSTASRDERSAADRAAERQAARREQPVGKQPSTPAADAPAPTAGTSAAQQEAAAARRAADAEDQTAAPAQDEAARTPAATETEAEPQPAQAGEADDASQPVDWVATLGLAPLAPAPAIPATLRGAAATTTAADALPAASGVAAAPGKLPMGDAAAAAMTAQDTSAPALVAGATAGDALAALATATAPAPALMRASASESPRGVDTTLQPALHLPGLAAAAGGGSAAAAPATAQIATPLHAPDFGQALAAQLTTFARDGVQEATLQLNPAEMGPIDVKIVVEGQQAQIDFSAAQAATRQALQDGLPGLAAALHAGGLTLAGGGVFEQRQPSRDPAQAAQSRASGARERGVGGVEATGRPAALPAARGLLDLYA